MEFSRLKFVERETSKDCGQQLDFKFSTGTADKELYELTTAKSQQIVVPSKTKIALRAYLTSPKSRQYNAMIQNLMMKMPSVQQTLVIYRPLRKLTIAEGSRT